MAREWDEEVDDIVVDDKPREDGLESDAESSDADLSDAARPAARRASQDAQQLAPALARIVQLLEDAAAHREQSEESLEDRLEERLAGSFDDLAHRIDALLERVAMLDQRLNDLSEHATTDSPAAIADDDGASSETSMPTEAAEAPEPDSASAARNEATAAPPGDADLLGRLVFGDSLYNDPSVESDRGELLDDVLQGRQAAIGLAARLMLVHAVGPEELASLLKEIGESYYRWRPKTADETRPMEVSLVKCLDERIAAVGLRNSIELIRPGDRYDATRHISQERGVEVSEVRGWAVLRDNGKPLTKANVGLR
ncbi:MAG: hypothetical protein RIC55_06735 [Pirellulaceae bacterium]